MNKILIAALPLILSACGGSGSDPVLSDGAGQGGTCGTAYYTELAGIYDGQIDYTSPDNTCAWNVEIELVTTNGPVNTCGVDVNMTSNLISGDSVCGDVGLAGPLVEPFAAGLRNDELDAVVFPVDGFVRPNAGLDMDTIFPVGVTNRVTQFTVQFDGMGNITYPATGADETFTGVLVKQ